MSDDDEFDVDVDDAQLERWAYGRATTPDEQSRAVLAAAELQRRAAGAAAAIAVGRDSVDEAAGGHPESPPTDDERRHRRRMLATGIAGVTAAALALGAGVVVLSQPNPDPMAIFERPETEADREWAQMLALDPATTITAGPRVFRDDDGVTGLVARVSTVPGGRSTDWDAYCLYVAREMGDGSWSATSDCTYPEQFAAVGISVTERISTDGEGYDTAIWGPVGSPRVERNRALNNTTPTVSVLDLLSNPLFGFEDELDLLSIVDYPDRLLMGPRRAIEAPLVAGDPVAVHLYLLEGLTESDEPEPELCMHVSHPETTPVTTCRPLWNARSSGIVLVTVIADEIWVVSVDVTGTVRVQQG